MFNYKVVRIERSENFKQTVKVPPWEVPVLHAVHGMEVCIELGETPSKRPLPDAGSEMQRLALRYKKNNDTGHDFVEDVYGGGMIGIKALEKAINDVPTSAPAAAEPTADETGDVGDLGSDLAALGLADTAEAAEITE